MREGDAAADRRALPRETLDLLQSEDAIPPG
jgi:hypothetical protein